MITLWERTWSGVAGDSSLSLEDARAEALDAAGNRVGPPMKMLLWIIGRERGRAVRLVYVGVMHVGRRPVGVAAVVRGRLVQRWWGGLRAAA